MHLVDVHCHLTDDIFSHDLDQVIQRAGEAGLTTLVSNGLDPTSNRAVLALAQKYLLVKPALGIHPISVAGLDETTIAEEIVFITKQQKKIVAIGECGLDYKHVEDPVKQKKVFQNLLLLAKTIKKPVIVHSRKAEEDVITLLEGAQLTKEQIVLHCFTGRRALITRAISNGWYFSIPAIINKDQHFQRLVGECTINQLLTETDAPYLSPERGKRNEPIAVQQTVQAIAKLKQMDVIEVANNIFMNYQRVFGTR
ncbi:TatD family hydrolase [Candidatus Woesearchaeota archaeon]|nr:TatD family hydrolase [Candidatus Woesearchaeota archaeon]